MKVLSIIGTRPEAIKMAPVIRALNCDSGIQHITCSSSQHEHMLAQVLEAFGINIDISLPLNNGSKSLNSLLGHLLVYLEPVVFEAKPNIILVHGDTSTTLAGALTAYYHKIPLAHIEAGLRTQDIYSPWPEEINRKLAASITHWHFVPTERARQNLIQEGFATERIHLVGNSIVDALLFTRDKLSNNQELQQACNKRFSFLHENKKLILITGHRRENFGEGLQNICEAINIIAQREDVDILYPVHLNPVVQKQVHGLLSSKPNVHLIAPVNYLEMVYLMQRCYLILTDSGGIQEEAVTLRKPVLIMRNTTERPEVLEAGGARLTGTESGSICATVKVLLENTAEYQSMTTITNPFGCGNTAQQIVSQLKQRN